jgi:hypothetical protein
MNIARCPARPVPLEDEVIESPDGEAATRDALLAALRGIRFGSVEAVIHDGRVVQINRVEKVRMDR